MRSGLAVAVFTCIINSAALSQEAGRPVADLVAEAIATTDPLAGMGIPANSPDITLLPGRVSGGLSYSTNLGAGVGMGLHTDKAFGYPVKTDFELTFAEEGWRGSAIVTRNNLWDRDITIQLALRDQMREQFESYEVRQRQVSLALARGGQWRLRGGLSWQIGQIDAVQIGTSPIIIETRRETLSFFGESGWQGEVRSTKFDVGATLSYGVRLVGDGTISRITASTDSHTNLGGNFELSSKLRVGVVEGEDLLVSEKFLGGANIMRGFSYGGIGPRDISSAKSSAIGGERFASSSLQLDYRLARFGFRDWTIGMFWDAGSVWSSDPINGIEVGEFELRQAAGVSLGWEVDSLRMQLDWVEAFDSEPYDKPETLRLSLTTRF